VRPIDIEELKKSDYVIFTAITLNNKLIGLSMIDKIVVNALDDNVKQRIVEESNKNSIMTLDLSIYCPEGDEECERKARAMGIEPNREVLAPLCIVAVSTRFIDIDKLVELLKKNFGELYTSFTMSYCSKNELNDELSEHFYIVSSMVTSESDRLFRSRGFEKLENKAILVKDDGSIEIVNVS